MEKIGESLRQAREAKNISIEDIVNETKIRSRYIEALEAEEWDIFPGQVYLKAFLKSYCHVLGIDEKPYLEALSKTVKTESEVAQVVPQKLEVPGRPKRKLGIVLGALAIILLIAFQYVYQNYLNQPMPVAKEPTVQTPAAGEPQNENPANSNEEEPPADNPPEIAAPTSITLRLVAINGRCWVRVKDGDRLVYEGTMNEGEEKVFTDLTMVSMIFGNSGGIRYYLNDQDYGIPGKIGQPVTKIYALENNTIVEKTT